jgi:hypothetical protein
MIDLGPQIIVPGHGEILHDTSYLFQVKNLLAMVVAGVRKEFYTQGNGVQLDAVRKGIEKTIDFDSLRRQFDGGNPDNFDQSGSISYCLVRNAYYEEKLR